MIDIRPFNSLGQFQNDWLQARYHFSFANYRDPARMGFGQLRVWNDDLIAANTGFDPHPHREMEIITYVREGAITHRDSLGNQGRTEAGDVQVMSAGTGIVHAEHNLEAEPTRLFQIWIIPDTTRAQPGWGTKKFPRATRNDAFDVLASGRTEDVGNGALPINANAAVLATTLRAGESVRHALAPGRGAYFVALQGAVDVNGKTAQPRDGVAVHDEPEIVITAQDTAEIVLVDIAM